MPAAGEPLLAGCLLPVSQSGYVRDGDGFVETRRAAPTPGPGLLAGARRRRGRPSRRGGGSEKREQEPEHVFVTYFVSWPAPDGGPRDRRKGGVAAHTPERLQT